MAVHRAVAIVGIGSVLPGAPDVPAFWKNLTAGRSSISEVDPARWDPSLYWDADHKAIDKTYSKIGGWVTDYEWAPLKWRLPIPPKVAAAMDRTQKWAITCAREALADYGYPERPLDRQRTAVILGNAMGGDLHYLTAMRVYQPEYAAELTSAASFQALPEATRSAILREFRDGVRHRFPDITEDTMPGELANIIAGRVASIFDFHGPNYITDAACASAMAAMTAAIEGLEEEDYDVALSGGVDANMSASTFVKFSKIGALSATGSRPFADGADGFVMGEGAVIFVLKRLADAERDGDRIYAVVRGMGGSSDGKGKGITAPNPAGQRAAIRNAWAHAGESPETATMVEAHGTSTRVGDVVEFESLNRVFGAEGRPARSIALGSVKSNIGHLKGAAGAAGMLKATLALHHKQIPPSLGFHAPNPNISFDDSPFYVATELKPWDQTVDGVRRAGVSSFGFGGTNFHAVLEEYVPGRIADRARQQPPTPKRPAEEHKAPLRGALVLGAEHEAALARKLEAVLERAEAGELEAPCAPTEVDLRAPVRLAIDHADAGELVALGRRALALLGSGSPEAWKALAGRGVFLGRGVPGKVAFLYTGQGSQYVGMLKELAAREPVVRRTFAEADAELTPLIGRPLTDIVFAERSDAAEDALRQTEVTQPAVLTVDTALARLLEEYGVTPDMVMGHSLGEYGALIAAHVLDFRDALRAVSARGTEMAKVSVEDNGLMAAVFGPIEAVTHILEEVPGYVVVANHNSDNQVVVGGETAAVQAAVEAFAARGLTARLLPVSHAFHTRIVAPASEPLMRVLAGFDVRPPELPLVANVDGGFYPKGPDAKERIVELLGAQVASPVRFVKGLNTLYDAGARVFVEVGPKRALFGLAGDVLADKPDVVTVHTNHPSKGDVVSFNRALCALYAAGLGVGRTTGTARDVIRPATRPQAEVAPPPAPARVEPVRSDSRLEALGRLFESVMDQGLELLGRERPRGADVRVTITGAGLGLPGGQRVFDPHNVLRILHGDQRIDTLPLAIRQAMADRHVTRLVKTGAGGPHFETIDSAADVVRLAGRAAELSLSEEFGYPEERLAALDRVTMLAIGAGLEALRDAGIPLVMRYKTTTTGSRLPDRWMLPESLRDETGVIFASAFPGLDALVDEVERYHEDRSRTQRLEMLRELAARAARSTDTTLVRELERRIHELEAERAEHAYGLDRKFLFRILSMGHSQFAEYIGARGPNTQVNGACASTTQAVALADDWIRAGRCRRVIVVSADDATSDRLMPWIGSGFLASGAAATDELVEDAAVPFDRRRHGMIVGMGAAALVLERDDAARERGVRPICEVLATTTANSAFHGTRLDVGHIAGVMEGLVASAEARAGVDRRSMAPRTVFVSHETYTPARGGSAQAEIHSLREVFGDDASRIVIANTKGFTGHAMGAGIEDVVAVKALETGSAPPVANLKEPDPELGDLTLSQGGAYDLEYALRLGAGFGSQVAMSLLRWIPPPDGAPHAADELGFEHRVEDPELWHRWLVASSGYAQPELEWAGRTLRVRHDGAPDPALHQQAPEPVPAQRRPPAPRRIPAPVTPPPAVQAPAPAPAPVQPPAASGDSTIEDRVLAIVAEQTGYPPDLLELDLDLEADLGIDTVKQAEMFVAIREAWGIERDAELKLRDYPTLAHVVGFVRDRAPAAAPVVEPEPVPEPEPEGDPIERRVLQIVSDQTGYPPDLLELDLDLEADLGIDTVKQAEMFVAIREAWDIERDAELKLRDYPTLAHVVGFVKDRAPAAPAEPAEPRQARIAEVPPTTLPRRVPVPALRPPLEIFAPTGVELGEGSRVLVAGSGPVASALVERLEGLGVSVLELAEPCAPEDLAARVAGWLEQGPMQGVYWLPALEELPELYAASPEQLEAALTWRVGLLSTVCRALGESLGFLVTATALGGWHGAGPDGASAPLGGAVTGFAKALRREREGLLVKAVDVPLAHDAGVVAGWLVDETLADPGIVELGRRDGRRWCVGLDERELPAGEGLALGSDSVFVVTGAAGSIVSAIVGDLAEATGGTFHLLDLTAAPDPEDPDLVAFEQDPEGLKRTLFARLKAAGQRATPAAVARQLAVLERSVAALNAIRAVEAAGGSAHWYAADLLDAEAMAGVTGAIAASTERVDVVIHGGGIEISRLLADKSPEEFALVFGIKAHGWFNLMRGFADTPVGATVSFGSIAGRFGNAGQTDYSAANDLLCKLGAHLPRVRPGTRGLTVDWTAWGEVGMASRGSIPKVMAAAGIDMLPTAEGVPVIRRELLAGPGTHELVVAGALGALEAPLHPSGGLREVGDAAGALLTTARAETDGHLAFAFDLDPAHQPFLDHHRIDGTPVLPGVMGTEAFTEAATWLVPGWHVAAVEALAFVAPVKVYRDEPRTVTVRALVAPDGDDLLAWCELTSERELSVGTQRVVHFRGRVRLVPEAPEPVTADPPARTGEGAVGHDEVYEVFFHGPCFQVIDEVWREGELVTARMPDPLPPALEEGSPALTVAPRQVELCFQVASLRGIADTGTLGLPARVGRVRFHGPCDDTTGGLVVLVRPSATGEGDDARVLDAEGRVLVDLERYVTVTLGEVDAPTLRTLTS